jgi:hypothetical protein
MSRAVFKSGFFKRYFDGEVAVLFHLAITFLKTSKQLNLYLIQHGIIYVIYVYMYIYIIYTGVLISP